MKTPLEEFVEFVDLMAYVTILHPVEVMIGWIFKKLGISDDDV